MITDSDGGAGDGGHGPRPGETRTALPEGTDAGVYFIGRIRTPWTRRQDCPKNAGGSEAVCTLALDPRWEPALAGLETSSHVFVLYWMDRAPRDLLTQKPAHLDRARGTFALRSPARPNPIALSVAELVGVEGPLVRVRGLDCLDGTPLLDVKPYFASVDAKPGAEVR